jgi:hypothetical protein
MGKCYVANLAAPVGCDFFPYPLFDLAVACAVARETDHTDRRCYPGFGLPIPASIIIAFLASRNFNATFSVHFRRNRFKQPSADIAAQQLFLASEQI